MRLRYAYADSLEAAGRLAEAREWFERAAAIDGEDETDAAERAELLNDADLGPDAPIAGHRTRRTLATSTS